MSNLSRPQEEDTALDLTLRPKAWQDYVGQEKLKKNLKIIIEAAKKRGQPVDHLLFYGGSGLGKCLNKESIVFSEKGMITLGTLGNLNKKGFQKKKVQIYSNPGPTFSSHFYNNGKSQTIKITTHQKYELEGTPNHRIIVLENGKILFKQLKDLKKGTFVAIQRGQNFFGKYTDLPTFYFPKKIWGSFDYSKYTIPTKMSLKLSRILGYLIGDGYVGNKSGKGTISFNNENPNLLRDFQKLWLEIFNQQTKIKKWGKKCPVIRTGNIKIRRFLLAIGLPYCTAPTKQVPFCIMHSPKKMVAEFLKAYFECDGHIRPDCRQMEINSASRTLLKQVQIVLLNFGIISRVFQGSKGNTKGRNPSWRLSITGEDVDIFLQEIGFISKKKNQVARNFSPTRNTNKDLVPFGKEKVREIRKSLIYLNKILQKKQYHHTATDKISKQEARNCTNKILERWQGVFKKVNELSRISDSHLFWDQIETIEVGEAHTVDLTIPSNHTFFANGFINHNTTLSHLVAKEMGANMRVTAGPAIEKAGDLAALLTNLSKGDVIFIDELHRLNKVCEEIMYPAMEDFKLNIIMGKGPMARTLELKVPPFTLIGATTRLALLSSPLRNRFGATFQLNFYNISDIEKIIQRSANILNVEIEPEAIKTIAARARFTPRVANRLLKRVRDFADVRGKGVITQNIAKQALSFLEIDQLGLEPGDRRILETIIKKFEGGPTGLQALAAASSEEQDTILDIYEPYLMQMGFIERTPRGRVATKRAYQHLDIKPGKHKGRQKMLLS